MGKIGKLIYCCSIGSLFPVDMEATSQSSDTIGSEMFFPSQIGMK